MQIAEDLIDPTTLGSNMVLRTQDVDSQAIDTTWAIQAAETAPEFLAALPDPLFVLDGDGRFTMLSPAWQTMTGSAVSDALGRYLPAMVHEDDEPDVRLQLQGLLSGLVSVWRGRFRFVTARRGDVWVEVHAAPQPVRGGAAAQVVGMLRDVTFSKESEQRLQRLALYDAALGIPNRTLLLDRLELRHARSKRHDQPPFGLAFIDLDDFKTINDTRGHLIGDEVLCAAARRLEGAVRASDTVARFGGDEFAVLLDEVRGPRDAATLALRMQRAVGRPLALDGQPVELSCSVGVVTSDVAYDDLRDLLGYADEAMYRAKADGNGVALYGSTARRPRHLFRRPWLGGSKVGAAGFDRGPRRTY